jgi:hypothetical protein
VLSCDIAIAQLWTNRRVRRAAYATVPVSSIWAALGLREIVSQQ